MIRNNVVSTTHFFYPVGNTPATSLTQDLPPEQSAAILLLGCGDARNILFTAYTSFGRHLDFTCCDIEPAILARNVLLFTLIIDDATCRATEALLDSQATKLIALSDTLETWNACQYGRVLRFCSQRTFAEVKAVWRGYSDAGLQNEDKQQRRDHYQAKLNKAKATKKNFMGAGIPLTGIRSAAPAGLEAMFDLSALNKLFWENGTVGEKKDASAKHPNPAFMSSPNHALTLHYGLDPLVGFHLATAYAPIQLKSALCVDSKDSRSAVVEAAKIQFRKWSQSFRQAAVDQDLVVRLFTGDALAFCHALQQVPTMQNSNNTNLYCHNWTFEPLKLDSGDYEPSSSLAPLDFDIIDTSNLVDHLGALNILVATAPLLADRLTSTLRTEVLVQHESSVPARLDNLLCGHYETISLLLGLASIESWTNATAIADVDESVFHAMRPEKERAQNGGTQVRSKLCWKLLSALDQRPLEPQSSQAQYTSTVSGLSIDAQALSRLIYSIYRAMFRHEDISTLMATLNTQGIQKTSNPYYNRASFTVLLKYIRNNVLVDWDEVLPFLFKILKQENFDLSVGEQYSEELFLHLHLVGISAKPTLVRMPDGVSQQADRANGAKRFATWKQVPLLLAMTFEVPRSKLKALTETPEEKLGTPSLCCTIQSSQLGPDAWVNRFAAVQTAFGNIKTRGNRGNDRFQLDINEDPYSWAGTSPLIVSCLIPTWILANEPQKAVVTCSLQPTPHAAAQFRKVLGLGLSIYETTLGDAEHVHFTKKIPNMSSHPCYGARARKPEKVTSSPGAPFRNTLSANLGPEQSRVVSLTCRIDLLAATMKKKLADKTSTVRLTFDSPLLATITIGTTIRREVRFSIPVSESRSKIRVARKSSYVEVVAPLLRPTDPDCSHDFMFPMSVTANTGIESQILPVNWNMPFIALDTLPVIDINSDQKLEWLTPHASFMFSDRERQRREAGIAGLPLSSLPQDERVDFKDGLFTLFMQFGGLQGGKAKVFALHRKDADGVHALLFISALRLDLANHTVVLDAAIFPLSLDLMKDSKVQTFLRNMNSAQTICMVNVTEAELRLWKHVLPAWAERCRTWQHKPASCEYIKTGEIPLRRGLEEGKTSLCSCGNGQIPPKFMGSLKMPNLDYVLQNYATRVAISPVFAVPYVEDCFNILVSDASGGQQAAASSSHGRPRCDACGSDKRAATDGASGALLTCTRCKVARYCSKECQRTDWKDHKPVCIPA